ncbi:MAG: cytochrome c biogenesis protein CcsA [Bacteroidetes bacterium]|nr:cytochrome c biogenesis protein CcsA [Bacteroidota bacterium]
MPCKYKTIRLAIIVWMTLVLLGAFSFGGVWLNIPKLAMLEHTARNLYFHVPMWFTMMALTALSAIHAIQCLRTNNPVSDIRSRIAALIAVIFGILGLTTGSVWAHYTWYEGTNIWWNFDPKQSMAAVQVLIYCAYFALRSALDDPRKRARISAVYNIFAFVTVPFLLYVLPRQLESLHPGAEGNPAFSEITDPIMRVIFYPAVLGFIGVGWLLYTQRVRLARAVMTLQNIEEDEHLQTKT